LRQSLPLSAVTARAEEPVYVYTTPPAAVAEREAFVRALEDYPDHRKLWNSQKHVSLTYTVRQLTDGMKPPAGCETLPVRVHLVDGEVKRATYAASGFKCHAGDPARVKRLLLTPDQFFARIEQGREELERNRAEGLNTTLRISYDPVLGLPIRIEDSSVLVADYIWTLVVTDIRRLK
jgi:hypothetical protein